MKVVVDLGKCVGGGQCVRAAPTVFSQNEDDGLAIVLMEHPPQALSEQVNDAARLCPAGAITIENDG
ncbi:MAG: ferredoxin [Reyranellaceae bacterium]